MKDVIDLLNFHHRRAKGGDKDSQRVVNEQIERHRALLTKADRAEEGGEGDDDQEDEEQRVSTFFPAYSDTGYSDTLYLHTVTVFWPLNSDSFSQGSINNFSCSQGCRCNRGALYTSSGW